MNRRLVAVCSAAACVFGLVQTATAAPSYTPMCLPADPGGWYATARDFAPEWWATASRAERDAWTDYVVRATGEANISAPLYVDRGVCIDPARIPATPTTTTTSSSTTVAPTTTTTTVPATTTSTVAPTTTTSSSTTTSPATSTTVAGACSGAPGTPGSPDGQGGCFPGPDNVGIPAGVTLTPYTGPCTITTANLTLDARDFTGCRGGLDIAANNVTISRSRIYDSVHGREANGFAFTITDSYLDGAQSSGAAAGRACVNCGVDGWNSTVIRTEIVHTNRGVYCMNHCVVRDSWVHAVNLDTRPCPQSPYNTCPHASGIRVEQYATLIHNTLACDFTGPFNDDLGCSADMSGYADSAPIHDNTLTNNLFRANPVGQAFCVYGGATNGKPESGNPLNATNVRFVNNVFERGSNGKCGEYGPVTDFNGSRSGNQWAGNVWSNGGTVAPG